MFYKIFLDLCIKNGKKPNHVTRELGLSNATATNWKQGSVPRDATLHQLASYFGVTVDYLLGKEEKPATESDELNEYLEELKNRSEMRMLFSLAKGATKEDVERAVAIIEALRKNET